MEPIILPRISDQKPLVSVVSITYNHEPYIRDCLEGFLMQKTTFPVEYIIHDDASTDHTADIIREYFDKRPDLFHVIIQRENQYSQNRPTTPQLYEMAQGKYIALCEGDDYWTDPLKLQKQFDFMEEHPDYSLCSHNAFILNEKNKSKSVFYKCNPQNTLTIKDVIEGKNEVLRTESLFFRSNMVYDYMKYKEKCPVGDQALIICLAQKGLIYYSQEIMSTYRLFAKGSWTSDQNVQMLKKHNHKIKMIDWLNKIRPYINIDEAIDYRISHVYLALFFEEKNYIGLKNNAYCKKLYDRLSIQGKMYYLATLVSLIILCRLKSKLLFRIIDILFYRKILLCDGDVKYLNGTAVVSKKRFHLKTIGYN